jgi:ribosomal protein S18 acetylase RimI-like enzyme
MASDADDLFREPGLTGLEHVLVRELDPRDLDAVVRIDARLSGRPRHEYFRRKIDEATRESGIRVSLAAESAGTFAGFLLGRLYYGEFGLPEPTAIIDTIGVEPELRGRHVGKAMLRQLEMNLRAVGIEVVQTQVDWQLLDLIGFLGSEGFRPAPVLCLEKRLA